MSTVEKEQKGITRRDFIKGAAAGGVAGLVVGGGGAALLMPKAEPKPWLPAKWDYEADVVVLGFGAAGSAAAIEAHDAGAEVILLEKMPEGLEGGDTAICGGLAGNFSSDIVIAREKTFGNVDEELLQKNIEACNELTSWQESMGLKFVWSIPGTVGYIADDGKGVVWFAALKAQVNKRGISVLYKTPGKELIQDPMTGKILGVKVESEGLERYIKARRGVVLATGGYESNLEMIGDFNAPGMYIASTGTPASTGDGHKMALKAGARLWHMAMGLEWFGFSFKVPSQLYNNVAIGTALPSNSFIFADKYGKRFMNEKRGITHIKESLEVIFFKQPVLNIPLKRGDQEYPHMPFFLVLDDKVMKSGPIGSRPPATGSPSGWNNVHPGYRWSVDNAAELSSGWILKADTIQELATKMTAIDWLGKAVSVDPAALVDTVNTYNGYCAAGQDPFARPKASLVPIDTPPYYAAELCLHAGYTLGGPKSNAQSQVLDGDNKPIPRLFAAGNLSSYDWIVPGGVFGALAFGRIAGRNAAAEKPSE